MEREGERRRVGFCWTVALAACALGLVFRVKGLATEPLWLDEAYSAFAADHRLAFIWRVVPRYETHPPFYYTLLHVWDGVFGATLLARRVPGFLCGSLAVGVTAAAARALARLLGVDRRLRALITAFATALAAMQPLMVQISHQVRPYPVMTLVYAVATLALLQLCVATRDGLSPPRRWLVLLVLAQALMLWLHALGPLFALALALGLLTIVARPGLSRADWAWLIGGEAAAGLIYVPAFLILLDQAPTWVKSSWLTFAPATVPAALATLYAVPGPAPALAALAAAVIGVAMLARVKGGARAAVMLATLAVLPVALALLASLTVAPLFLERTLSPVSVPMLLLFAAALAIAPRWRRIVAALLLVILVPSAWADRQASRLPPVEDWYGAVRWLEPRLGPRDVVWAYPNESALPLDYALRDLRVAIPVRPIPAPMPAFGWSGTYPAGGRGAPALFPAAIAAITAGAAARAPETIWLLSLAGGRYDPDGLMAASLGRSRDIVARYHDGGIDIVALRRRDVAARAHPAARAAAGAAR